MWPSELPMQRDSLPGPETPQGEHTELLPVPLPAASPDPQLRDDLVTLISGTVVNQCAFANNCGVPFGALLDYASLAVAPLRQVVGRLPVRCNSCSGFMNIHCKVNLSKSVWKCCFCGLANIAGKGLTAQEASAYPELCEEAVEYVCPEVSSPSSLSYPVSSPASQPTSDSESFSAAGPAAAAALRGTAKNETKLQPPHVVFAVDATLDAAERAGLRAGMLSVISSLGPSTLVSIVSFDAVISLHHLGGSPTAPGKSDLSASATNHGSHASATGAAQHGPRYSHTLPASVGRPVDPALLSSYAHSPGTVLTSPLGSSSSSHGCSAVIPLILDSLRPLESQLSLRQRPRCLASAVEASIRLIGMQAGLDAQDPQRPSMSGSDSRSSNRIQTAQSGPLTPLLPPDLVMIPNTETSPRSSAPGQLPSTQGCRVIVLTGGPVTWGPGFVPLGVVDGSGPAGAGKMSPKDAAVVAEAQRYFAALGEMASKAGIMVDIISASVSGHNAPLLSAFTRSTGGDLLTQAGMGPLLGQALWSCLTRTYGFDATLDCYVTDGASVVQWIGALEKLKPHHHKAGTYAGAATALDARRLSSSACSVTALDAGRAGALLLELTKDVSTLTFLALQIVLQYVDRESGVRVQRVVTRRVKLTGSKAEFVASVNAQAAAVLVCKRLVLEAKKTGAARNPKKAEELRYAASATAALLGARCGTPVIIAKGLLGLGTRKHNLLPSQLLPLAQSLYQFSRGSCIGAPVPTALVAADQTSAAAAAAAAAAGGDASASTSAMLTLTAAVTPDERAQLLDQLLWAGTGTAYRMLQPQLTCPLPEAPAPVKVTTAPLVPQPSFPTLLSRTTSAVAAAVSGLSWRAGSGTFTNTGGPELPPAAATPRAASASSSSFSGRLLLEAALAEAAREQQEQKVKEQLRLLNTTRSSVGEDGLVPLPAVDLALSSQLLLGTALMLDTGSSILVSPELRTETQQFGASSEAPRDYVDGDGNVIVSAVQADSHAVQQRRQREHQGVVGGGLLGVKAATQTFSPLAAATTLVKLGPRFVPLTHMRFPPPDVRLAPGRMLCLLTPASEDCAAEQVLNCPQMAGTDARVVEVWRAAVLGTSAAVAPTTGKAAKVPGGPGSSGLGPSFMAWCKAANLQPYPAVSS